MEEEVPIRYVNWGVANRFDDGIELNVNLQKYPKLHDTILRHELGHKKDMSQGQHMRHDLLPTKVSNKEMFVFMFKHPKSLIQFFPFYWSSTRKQIIYDLNMIIIQGIMLAIIVGGVWLFR